MRLCKCRVHIHELLDEDIWKSQLLSCYVEPPDALYSCGFHVMNELYQVIFSPKNNAIPCFHFQNDRQD